MKLVRLIQRRILRSFSSSTCFDSSKLVTAKKPESLTKIISILEKSDPIEPALDRVKNIIDPDTVSTVFSHRPSLQLGFRFLIWAMKRKRLQTWKLNNYIADMFVNENGGFGLWWDTLDELRRCGIDIPSDAFLVLVLGYWKAGNVEKAIESFGKMKEFDCKPDVYAYNAILYVIVQKELLLLAFAVYNKMLKLSCCPNIATYSILLQGLCKSGKMQDALELFDEMTERGISPNSITYTIVLSGLCHAKRACDAEMLLNNMKSNGCHPDEITFNAVLAGFFKSAKIDEAFVLLNSFLNQGYALGINGYSCLIDGLFRARRFGEANKWFHKLCKKNISPDVVLYTIMIRGFCEAGQVIDALNLLQEMTDRGVVADTQCYNALIKGLCDVGLLDDAKSLKLEISKNNCFPNTSTYTILICGMCRKGLVGEAKQIFQEMEKLGCFPSVVTFNALINGLCKAGELKEACLLFCEMELGRNPSLILRLSQGTEGALDSASLPNLVTGLCDSGLYLKAYRLLTELAHNGVFPDIITYNTLINGMCKNGDVDAAFKLFRKLQLQGQSPDSVTYGTLINGLYRVGREEEAVAVFDDMMTKGYSPGSSVYKCLLTWSCRKGKVSVSFSLWLKYLRSLKSRDDEAIKLIEEHFERGKLKEAIQGLLEMDFKLKEFDFEPYTIWLIGLCQAGRVEEAMGIFHVLRQFNITVTPPSCVRLIKGLCSRANFDLAVDVFLYTLESGLILKRKICNALLLSLLRSRDYAKLAFNLIRKMEYVGYDLDTHLYQRTKSFLQSYLNVHESEMVEQNNVVYEMASPG